MYGIDIRTLHVYIQSNNQRSLLWSKSGNQGNVWKTESLNVTVSNLSSEFIFQAVRGSDSKGDIAIDDISFSSSSCAPDNGKYLVFFTCLHAYCYCSNG